MTIHMDALLSDCGTFRYWLGRHWDIGAHTLPIIMLNPSTADANIDDRTIRRCMEFARRERFGGIRVANLFALRSTSPDVMKAAADPIGPDNDRHLAELLEVALANNVPVLVAWGTDGSHRGRDAEVLDLAAAIPAKLVCLGTTKHGHPRHPLYVLGSQPFEPFRRQGS